MTGPSLREATDTEVLAELHMRLDQYRKQADLLSGRFAAQPAVFDHNGTAPDHEPEDC